MDAKKSLVEVGTSGSSRSGCVAIEGYGIEDPFVRCDNSIVYIGLLDAAIEQSTNLPLLRSS